MIIMLPTQEQIKARIEAMNEEARKNTHSKRRCSKCGTILHYPNYYKDYQANYYCGECIPLILKG
jgi:late competence protein required for DNA uptake (superfamily II DNA/RNA helicase)